jgi:hypothetical protein
MSKKIDSIWPFLAAVDNYLRYEPAPKEKKWKDYQKVARMSMDEVKKKATRMEGLEGPKVIGAGSVKAGGRPICAPFPQWESLILIELINLKS